MKYIRTKDGIHLRRIFNEECSYEEWKSLGYTVIKESDTIPELCDVKVAIRKSNQKSYLGHFSGPNFFQEDNGWLGRVDSYEIIYGAIWIDIKLPDGRVVKRLEPVAIMNDKGNWELL